MNALLAFAAALAALPSLPGDCIEGAPVEAAGEVGPLRLAVEIQEGRPVLRATGRIDAGATERLVLALQDTRIDEIWFDSPGGDFREALLLGRAIRERGMLTRVASGARCAGACAEAFLGGIGRFVDPGGWVGFVAIPLSDSGSGQSQAERENAAARWTERRADYYIRAGVSRGLLRLQLDVPAAQICWLSPEALRRHNAANNASFAR